MARDFQINGETMVKVKFGAHLSGGVFGTGVASGSVSNLSELGLALGGINIEPRFYHYDINVDDFGPNVPAEVMWQLAEVKIGMTLVHYDQDILNPCISESMAGGTLGTLVGAGTMMGRGLDVLASGCHYMSLNLINQSGGDDWRFRASYLADMPITVPLGTKRSLTRLTWRAIPYWQAPAGLSSSSGQEIKSRNTILWDTTPDT